MPATSAAEWKGRGGAGTELELPSGNVCLVRNPGMRAFLKAGIIPDPLTSVIQKAIATGQEPDIEELTDGVDLDVFFELIDDVLMFVVIEPKVAPVPMKGGEPVPFQDRDQDKIYVDEVDMDDKNFIFQFAVGGTRDLERFRHEQNAQLERVRAVSADAGSSK